MVASERLLGFGIILIFTSFNGLETQLTALLLAAYPSSTIRSIYFTCIRDDPDRFHSTLDDEMLIVSAISETQKKRRI